MTGSAPHYLLCASFILLWKNSLRQLIIDDIVPGDHYPVLSKEVIVEKGFPKDGIQHFGKGGILKAAAKSLCGDPILYIIKFQAVGILYFRQHLLQGGVLEA